MIERLLSEVESGCCRIERDHEGNYQILPKQATRRWKLQQAGDRWLLIVGGVPQIHLHLPEAIAFLKRHCFKESNPKMESFPKCS
jgi:hypothetical protein